VDDGKGVAQSNAGSYEQLNLVFAF